MHRASTGTLGTRDSGLAGIVVATEGGRWVKAHTGGTVTDWNKPEPWSQQNEGQTPAVWSRTDHTPSLGLREDDRPASLGAACTALRTLMVPTSGTLCWALPPPGVGLARSVGTLTSLRQKPHPSCCDCIQCFSTTRSGFSSRRTEKRGSNPWTELFFAFVRCSAPSDTKGNQAGPEAWLRHKPATLPRPRLSFHSDRMRGQSSLSSESPSQSPLCPLGVTHNGEERIHLKRSSQASFSLRLGAWWYVQGPALTDTPRPAPPYGKAPSGTSPGAPGSGRCSSPQGDKQQRLPTTPNKTEAQEHGYESPAKLY